MKAMVGTSRETKRDGENERRKKMKSPIIVSPEAWGIRSWFNTIAALFMVSIIIAIGSLSIDNNGEPAAALDSEAVSRETCNLFSGEWVYDNSSRPLYSGLGCSFMHDEVACDKFGRKDTRYQGWRWQPHGCDLPRFNATRLLQKLRGKRLVFVGDSLNRNQWVSMVCLLESSIPTPFKSMVFNGSLLSFKAKEFNASIDFYWSPLLLESNCDNPVSHRLSDRVMRARSIETHARNWMDADILIFNSYLWWRKPGMKLKVMYGSLDDENAKHEEMEMIQGFGLALDTWSDWLMSHVDTLKTQIFFMSLSPTHIWGGNWGMKSGQNCYNETEPIIKGGYMGRASNYDMMSTVEDTMKRLKNRGVKVQILNVTELSEHRKDGHPSIYRKQWFPLNEDQLANPSSYADCTHWCLPGVPDVWNELLNAYII